MSDANNSKCDVCPANSKSNPGRTSCLCNDGFYKKSELHVAPCKGNRRSPSYKILFIIYSKYFAVSEWPKSSRSFFITNRR